MQKIFTRIGKKLLKSLKIFPLNFDKKEKQELRDKEEENKIRDENGLIDYKRLKRLINLKGRDINNELVRKHFQVQNLGALLEIIQKEMKFRKTWQKVE